MANPPNCPDDQFLEYVEKHGVQATAKAFGYSSTRAVANRIRALRNRETSKAEAKPRHYAKVKNGTVVIGSDMHYWVGLPVSTAHLAMVRLCRELRPQLAIANGDVIDAPSVSKHPSIGWEKRPALWDEVLEAQDRLGDIDEALPEESERIWNLGNHDARFETHLANVADQYRGVQGIHLKDHFPAWTPAWATWINTGDDLTVIKHRVGKGAGGLAVTRNFAKTGTHIITSHTHAANVWAFSNYRGTFYAVDTGTLAVPYGEQFTNYTEDDAVNWRSAVTVLTYADYKLLPPEQLIVIDEAKRLTAFRGQIFTEVK